MGDILHDFLEVSLNADGTLQPSAISQAGAVTSVNTIAPDGSGNVTLTAGSVGAVPSSQVGSASGVASVNLSGVVPAGQLGSGSASSSTYLRGDGSWATPSSGAQALAPVTVQTYANSPVTAAVGQFIPVDTTNGDVAVTLPTSPADASRIEVKMVKQGGSNTVTVNAGGSNTFNDDGSTSGTLKLLNQAIMLQYSANAGVWYVQSDDLPLTQLDGRYLSSGGVTVSGTPAAGQALVASSASAALGLGY